VKAPLCNKAQSEFNAFVVMPIVPIGQLYGGKICAALDRQHPRDLFDVKYLLENEGFSQEVKTGFLLSLLASDRPIHEILSPGFQDHRSSLINQFEGMSLETFNYSDFEHVRESLVRIVNESLSAEDRNFILSAHNLQPNWSIYDFEKFPAVQWKLQNIMKLKEKDPTKHLMQYNKLRTILKV
jgi:hypothetical protein